MAPAARLLLALAALAAAACETSGPYVRYRGDVLPSKVGTTNPEVLRTGPPADRYHDLGTVSVTCPSWAHANPLGVISYAGGCSYDWAVWQAGHRALEVGGAGIHSLDTTTNADGKVVTLRATAFVHLAPPPPATKAEDAAKPGDGASVEARLKHLEQLKTEQLITPEEYAVKRAEILQDL